jgi:GNAT superfamily N-acetyltransferase
MDIKFKQESYLQAVDDIKKVLDDHLDEIKYDHDNINFSLYKVAEEKGLLKIYTARDNGDLVGYCVMSVSKCNKSGKIKAYQELFYVKPVYRRIGLGKAIIYHVDKQLKFSGVQISVQSVPYNIKWDNLLLSIGYKKHRTIYEKEI